MSTTTPLVNAWIFLNEDEPSGTSYSDPTSCYQTLIQNNVYQSVDILFLCFATTLPTSSSTIPAGNGSAYTIEIGEASHPNKLTNQDYMNAILKDARASNPNIKIAITLNYDADLIENIFSNQNYTPQQNAANFAANLMTYLQHYHLDGFDIDWERDLSNTTSREHFALLINAIGAEFKQQTNKHYYLTLSPAWVDNLDAESVNNNVDFINLQLYSGFTYPDQFTQAGANPDLFAYGVKFESGQDSAQSVYDTNQTTYHYTIFTCWRLNSDNFAYEQQQQQELYKLVFPTTSSK